MIISDIDIYIAYTDRVLSDCFLAFFFISLAVHSLSFYIYTSNIYSYFIALSAFVILDDEQQGL